MTFVPGQVLSASDLNAAITAASDFVLLNKTDFTGSSAVNINSVFSATYPVYLIVCTVSTSGTDRPKVRLRVGGANAAGSSDYIYAFLGANGTTASSTTGMTSSWLPHLVTASGVLMPFQMTLINPAAAVPTQMFLTGTEPTATLRVGGGSHALSTAYDGFSITPEGAATLTGTVLTYGLVAS